MKVNYVLHKNHITPDPEACTGIVVNMQVNSNADVIKQITGEGSILKVTECTAVTDAYLRQIGINLANGIGFSCDFFSVGIGMQGVYINTDDKFDPNRHTLYVNIIPGKPWKESLGNAILEKVNPEDNKPKISSIFDLKSKTNNQALTRGGMAEIEGYLLKIDETIDDEGLFLISENGGGEVKVAYIYQNFPKSIQFEVPETLAAGNYRLEVRNRAYNCKTIRKGISEYALNVA